MIEINNLSGLTLDEKFFKKVSQAVLKGENKEKHIVSIAFITEKEIRGLNKKYLKKDKPTDVLSFSETRDFLGKIKEFKNILGEVVICPHFIKKNTNPPFKKELSRALIHGILHLLGYSHEKSDKKEKEMRSKENYYLSLYFSIIKCQEKK
ncbi:MAG: rRNA maturation RNase YbeY [Candidatus Nealsonbacteria bacterium]